MRLREWLALLMTAFAACAVDRTGLAGGPDSGTHDLGAGDGPGVDLPSSGDLGPDLGGCTPGCHDGQVDHCDGSLIVVCTSGCNALGTDCAQFRASNVPPAILGMLTGTIDLAGTVDTTVCNHDVAHMNIATDPITSGTSCVWHGDVATLASGGLLRATGMYPLIIVANTVTIDGVVDVSASGLLPGAGSAPPAATGSGLMGSHGDSTTPFGAFSDSGGGGGGLCGAGGSGGGGGATVGGAGGGAALASSDLRPLRGGSHGGTGGDGAAGGGQGGGAVQISALTSLSVTGVVVASGGGGQGTTSVSNHPAGGGGGSGGGILLESPSVTFGPVSALFAVGGGGGGGGSSEGAPGSGADGAQTADFAPGGPSGGAALGTVGGNSGSASAIDGQPGGSNASSGANGGGGGGGAGCIVVRSHVAVAHTPTANPLAAPGFRTLDVVHD